MKITIVSKREYSFVGKKDGAQVSGFMYGGFDEDNNPIEFSSQNSQHEVSRATRYNPDKAVDVEIMTKFFNGKVTFRENVHTPV